MGWIHWEYPDYLTEEKHPFSAIFAKVRWLFPSAIRSLSNLEHRICDLHLKVSAYSDIFICEWFFSPVVEKDCLQNILWKYTGECSLLWKSEESLAVLNPHIAFWDTEFWKVQSCGSSSIPDDTAACMCVAPTLTGQTVGRRIKLWRCICGKESFYSFMV